MGAPVRVTAQASEAGWTPVAFIAVVEVIDPDGERHFEVVASDGITDARRDRLRKVIADA